MPRKVTKTSRQRGDKLVLVRLLVHLRLPAAPPRPRLPLLVLLRRRFIAGTRLSGLLIGLRRYLIGGRLALRLALRVTAI